MHHETIFWPITPKSSIKFWAEIFLYTLGSDTRHKIWLFATNRDAPWNHILTNHTKVKHQVLGWNFLIYPGIGSNESHMVHTWFLATNQDAPLTIFCPITISGGPSFGLGSNLRLYKANDSYKICTVNWKWRLTSSSWAFSMRRAWRIEQANNAMKPWTFTNARTLIPAHRDWSPHPLPHQQLHPHQHSQNPPPTPKRTLTLTPTTPGEE